MNRKESKMSTKELSVKEIHKLLKSGKVKLRSLKYIQNKEKKGYNKNYIRDWFNLTPFQK